MRALRLWQIQPTISENNPSSAEALTDYISAPATRGLGHLDRRDSTYRIEQKSKSQRSSSGRAQKPEIDARVFFNRAVAMRMHQIRTGVLSISPVLS